MFFSLIFDPFCFGIQFEFSYFKDEELRVILLSKGKFVGKNLIGWFREVGF